MFGKFENLERCCGGKITAESTELFQRAMVEYVTFIDDDMRQLVAPGGMIIEVIERKPGSL